VVEAVRRLAVSEDEATQSGLIHALILDGKGGARAIDYARLANLQLGEQESLWLHWQRNHPRSQAWLRKASGLSDFACDLLLEENTRPRLLPLPGDELLLFLRGVNLNPGAEPEDMVSLRIFADARRVISLRLRSLRSTDELIRQWAEGRGPKSPSEIILYLADALTEKVDHLIESLSEEADAMEESTAAGETYTEQGRVLLLRRRAAGLRRFLSPQRELFTQLTRHRLPWFADDDGDYWNELSNRLVRYLEELELIRERGHLILESEQRRMSERMGRTMYLLAIITCFFLPMTFLTGLLGINVGGIPGADSRYGFAVACLLMAVLGLSQWWVFRRLRWL
jgi:zinc transporter